MANFVCNQCNSKHIFTDYEPPLADFSQAKERVTLGKISIEFRWDNSPVSVPVQVSNAITPTLTQLSGLDQLLKNFSPRLVTLIDEYAKHAIANFSYRPICLCPDSLQGSVFHPFHKALKKAFPKDPSVDQLHEVPAMTVFVPRPQKPSPDNLYLHFPKHPTSSIAFRVFHHRVTAPNYTTMGPDPCFESRSFATYQWENESSVEYTTALIVATETGKICQALMIHTVDPEAGSLSNTSKSCAMYRKGILKGLPQIIKTVE